MDEVYYVRMKSRLTGKRFWRDKAFEGSRRSCSRFAEGNKIASKVYGMVYKEDRVYKLFCFLKKKAIRLLKSGMNGEEAGKVLVEYLVGFGILSRKENVSDCRKAIAVDKELTKASSNLIQWTRSRDIDDDPISPVFRFQLRYEGTG